MTLEPCLGASINLGFVFGALYEIDPIVVGLCLRLLQVARCFVNSHIQDGHGWGLSRDSVLDSENETLAVFWFSLRLQIFGVSIVSRSLSLSIYIYILLRSKD